jgi:hypothetical protein
MQLQRDSLKCVYKVHALCHIVYEVHLTESETSEEHHECQDLPPGGLGSTQSPLRKQTSTAPRAESQQRCCSARPSELLL